MQQHAPGHHHDRDERSTQSWTSVGQVLSRLGVVSTGLPRNGLDLKTLTDIINHGSGRSWTSEVYNPAPGVLATSPASNAYQPGFAAALMAKVGTDAWWVSAGSVHEGRSQDLGLAQDLATASRAPTPLGSLSHQLYRLLARSAGQQDFSAVYGLIAGADQSGK